MRQSFLRALIGFGVLFFAGMGCCTRFNALNTFVPCSGYARTANIAYGDLPRQKLDVYRPCHMTPATPVVIFFYGGDWQAGEKADYRFVAQALTSRGFIAVLPDYRVYPSATFPAFLEDGALAVKWVHGNIARLGGDPDHIYLMGHSAGAHIAAMLTLDGSYLQAVGLKRSVIRATAALSGPYNFMPGEDDRAVFGMTSADSRPDPRIEPIHFVDGHEPPMLLLHGLRDKVVDPENVQALFDRIRQMGGEATYIAYPHLGHVGVVLALASPFRGMAPVLRDVTEFFREH